MSRHPDIAGVYAALARLPGRTAAQLRYDELAVDALRAADEMLGRTTEAEAEDAFEPDAAAWAVARPRHVRLGRKARTDIADALDVDVYELEG